MKRKSTDDICGLPERMPLYKIWNWSGIGKT